MSHHQHLLPDMSFEIIILATLDMGWVIINILGDALRDMLDVRGALK